MSRALSSSDTSSTPPPPFQALYTNLFFKLISGSVLVERLATDPPEASAWTTPYAQFGDEIDKKKPQYMVGGASVVRTIGQDNGRQSMEDFICTPSVSVLLVRGERVEKSEFDVHSLHALGLDVDPPLEVSGRS